MAMTPGTEPSAAQPNQNTPENLCAEVLALIPAYALGATDPEETRLVQMGLAGCPDAAAALADYTALAEQMHFAAPRVAAPEHLAQRLQAALSPQSAPPGTPHTAKTVEKQPKRGGLSQLWTFPSLGFAAAALALLLLITSNLYWSNRYNDLAAQQSLLQRQLQQQTTLVTFLRAGQMERRELASASGGLPESRAILMYQPTAQQALLFAEGLPPLSPDQVYQLWLVKDDNRISGGLFQVDANGYGLLLIDAPLGLGSYDRMGVTPEPAGGSPGPTAPAVVRASF
ncbi:MAG: anti-sigma factor [Caldilineaceae bacterium]|nr:anti-sigma factor [Caldilineaceae bacterium]